MTMVKSSSQQKIKLVWLGLLVFYSVIYLDNQTVCAVESQETQLEPTLEEQQGDNSELPVQTAEEAQPAFAPEPTAPAPVATAPVIKAKAIEQEVVKAEEEKVTQPGNVSLDFKDADIINVLRVLSLKSGVNIVSGPEVQGTVTIRLEDVPWEKALQVVLRTYGYVYEREGNIIRVTTKENLATEELVTETFVLNYTTAAEVESAIKDILSERGRVKSVPRANTVIVTDIPTNLYKISQVIQNLDKSTPQVYIDAKIVRTQMDQNESLGIQWNPTGTLTGAKRDVTFPFTAPGADNSSNPLYFFKHFYAGAPGSPATDPVSAPTGTPDVTAAAAKPTFTFGTMDFQSLQAILSLVRAKTNTKIISNPRIVVLNNQTAKVKVGSEIPIPTFERNETTGSFVISGFTYRDTGVVLNVTPHINNADEILVDVKPEVSSRGSDVSFGGTSSFTAPSFNATNAQTQVLIQNGETIAIGGLMRDVESVTEKSVPGFSRVPLIGKLFRSSVRASGDDSNQKVETIFFITVTIVDTQGQRTVTQAVATSVLQASRPTAVSPVGA